MNPYTNTPSTYLLDLLIELKEYMDSRADVESEPNEDGSYPPNKEMTLAIEIEEHIEQLEKQNKPCQTN